MIRSSQSTLIAMAMGNFGVLWSAFAVIAVMPAIIAEHRLTAFQGGLLISAFALIYATLSPLLGWLAARVSYRMLLVGAVAIAAAGVWVTILADGKGMLFLGRVLAAIGAALFTPAAASLAISISAPHLKGRALAIVGMGPPLSQVVGLPLTAFLAGMYGWRFAFIALVPYLLIVAASIASAVPPAHRPTPVSTRDFKAALTNKGLLRITLLTCMMSTACNIVYTFQTQIFIERAALSETQIGIALLCLGLGALAGNWLAGISIDRIGATRTLILQCTTSSVIVLAATLTDYGLVTACILAAGLGGGLFNFIPATQLRLMQLKPDSAGLFFSINSSFLYLGTAAGGLVSGTLAGKTGTWALGPASATLLLAIAIYLLVSDRKMQGR